MVQEPVKERLMSEPLLTIKEVRDLLNVPRSWLYERTRKGEIPHVKLGKYVRFDREELLQWINKRRVKA